MSIPCGEDIGVEIHCDTDQYIRVEQGMAIAFTGNSADNLCHKRKLNTGDAIFIPAGTWHNIVNASRRTLKLSSVYAPPHHPKCTVDKVKNEK
jgi:mannose-6-phosphate isomerase-like protein (cupin superfamily)